MKIWTNNEFRGHFPVGSAAVVIADNAEDAAKFLAERLKHIGLEQIVKAEDMDEFYYHEGYVRILCDGDY